ncbi:D-aminoacyl-tRNA deacylase [Aquibacillus salsiterrae]|uniref:D-aminoacyl-tRNA deacylase n=1 Tax=Aquibacillus salsiterrae TaxID=2950439 RepID=A0A9X4AEX0_9BACI|nr:D-aminoacyl-tRNA deacylase [Aquibacillus salsiterrae]MDC3415630.1 D-aminoacyl-tRNA deacylase [Aquibacillus salsiterrae]
MRVVIQRAENAKVVVEDKIVGEIDQGLVVLLGITHDDQMEDAAYLAYKIANLRIFEDENAKMNLSLKDVGGKVLSISQFTLYGDTRKGRRPNFMNAAKPEYALALYQQFNTLLESEDVFVETGQFGEMMRVQFTNVGPVTLLLDSRER